MILPLSRRIAKHWLVGMILLGIDLDLHWAPDGRRYDDTEIHYPFWEPWRPMLGMAAWWLIAVVLFATTPARRAGRPRPRWPGYAAGTVIAMTGIGLVGWYDATTYGGPSGFFWMGLLYVGAIVTGLGIGLWRDEQWLRSSHHQDHRKPRTPGTKRAKNARRR